MTEAKDRKRLLAKSKRDGKEFMLLDHLLETARAAKRVFRLDKRWGRNWCRFFRLTDEALQARFLLNLRVAALLHDIGKANADFYKAVTMPGFTAQTLRHEHLSALILHLPEVRQWLVKNRALDVEIITAAVLSHHLKAQEEKGEWQWCQPHGAKSVRLALHDPDIKFVLRRIKRIAQLGDIPKLPSEEWSVDSSLWTATRETGGTVAFNFGLAIKEDDERHRLRLLLAVKAGLIVADAVASGLVRESHNIKNHSINKWIDEKVHSEAITSGEVAREIIEKRKQQLSRLKSKPFKFNGFQEQASSLSSRALLLAPCGSGKTLAAWRWAERQAHEHEVGKVIFLYPTRGTATEGFRDYVGWAPEASAALVHGASRYELEAIQKNPDEKNEATRNKNFRNEKEDRLFALAWWSRRFFSATVDQFLGFMEHSYKSLCLLPVLADSILIVDEVHSFDQSMFRSLMNFLRTFDLPVLCMTATLSPKRIQQLEEVGLKKYPTEKDYKDLADLRTMEEHPRYRLSFVASKTEALARALAAYRANCRANRRVLWVVNTVNRCQAIAERLTQELGEDVICYHSRFTLKDRKEVHDKTIEAFQQRTRPYIAVTTQVCEMSLDLDADVLITEFAPPSSLVQRFGRANRRLEDKPPDFRAGLIVYRERERPYTLEEINAGEHFLHALGEGEASQRRLADVLENHVPDEPFADDLSLFLNSGYFAVRGEFRDGDELTNPCVLDRDLDKVRECIEEKKPYDAFIVGVPRSSKRWRKADEKEAKWLPKYLGVAQSEFYHERYGFLTEGNEKW